MLIFAVTPIHISAESLARRQRRYDSLSPQGIKVHLTALGPDAPQFLDTEQDIQESERLVVEALLRAPVEADALMPDCVLDPGLEMLSKQVSRPVFGLLRLSLCWGAAVGHRLSAVTRNEAIATELTTQVRRYGISESWAGVEVLALGGEVLTRHDEWVSAVAVAAKRSDARGATAMINGCSGIGLPEGWQPVVPVVDPVSLAMRMLAAGPMP